MKQIASILLALILLFNWFGYRVLTNYLERHANYALEQKLDNADYDDSQLIEIKVPLDLPYQTNWKEFERFDGEVEVEGIHYKYVKRKVVNDSLVLLCLPNESKMKLQSARDEFFKLVNDLQHPSHNKKSDKSNAGTVKSPVSEYYNQSNTWLIPKLTALHLIFTENSSRFNSCDFQLTPEQPPEV